MVTSWLADADPESCWAHQSWTALAALPQREYAVAILPVHGFADHGPDRPVDAGEMLGATLLRAAVMQARQRFTVRVLPPLRFLPAPAGGWFGVDVDTAESLLRAIASGVKAAGFHKLVLFNTSVVNEPVVAAAAVDLRAGLGLRTYVIQARALGMDLARHRAEDLATPAGHLAGLLGEVREHRAPPLDPGPATEAAGPAPACAPHPVYRSRYLGALSAPALRGFAAPPGALAVLPVAALEQHGPHLPLGVDAILGQALLAAALERVPAAAPVFVTPAIAYGKSNEHAGFPGTIALAARDLRHVVGAVARQLRDLGIRRLALLNTHGGNSATLAPLAHEMRDHLGIEMSVLRPEAPAELAPQEAAWGFHAGEWETALMLACAPELVRLDRAVAEYPAHLADRGELRPEHAPATFGWITSDISRTGVIGDPTRASVANGRLWLETAATRLARRIAAPPAA